MANELEKDFYADSFGKKKTAASAHKMNRTGKGRVLLPMDYLKGKRRKEYMQPTYTKTEDLSIPMNLTSFKKLSRANQKLQLEIWGNVYGHSSATIGKVLGVSQGTAYRILVDAGLMETFKQKYKAMMDDKSEAGKQARTNKKRALALATGAGAGVEAATTAVCDEPVTDVKENENAPQAAQISADDVAAEIVPDAVVEDAAPENDAGKADELSPALVLDVVLPGAFAKAAMMALADGKTYRVIVQEL